MTSVARCALAGFAPALLLAQFQVFLVEDGAERRLSGFHDIGIAAVGDHIDTVFRIRNAGGSPALLDRVTVAGAGFALLTPVAADTLAAGAHVDATVRFAPPAFGIYSANLTAVNASLVLRGSAALTPVVSVEQNGVRSILASGAVIPFGTLERGARATRAVKLENTTPRPLEVSAITVLGDAFALLEAATLPLRIAPRESVAIAIAFAPSESGEFDGWLAVDDRAFRLRGTAVDPPLPRPLIVLEPAAYRSGEQGRVRIQLESPAGSAGTGELRLEFRPASPLPDSDIAIQFLASRRRTVPFTVSQGATTARFDAGDFAVFQTGATAGSFVIVAELGGHRSDASFGIAPAAVSAQRVTAARSGANIEVEVAGFDNTRTVSRAAFVFYDRNGQPVPPGEVQADVAAEFRRFFDTSDLGGQFSLRAVFPVTGSIADVAAVEIEFANSAGTSRTQRVQF
ncbi:MAG: choice-of-anchor D domain-containing protein [Acidobacteria bacterium]|nr:choice-of-anchor D domain-containing protein [Acidobacteriota bacterium]